MNSAFVVHCVLAANIRYPSLSEGHEADPNGGNDLFDGRFSSWTSVQWGGGMNNCCSSGFDWGETRGDRTAIRTVVPNPVLEIYLGTTRESRIDT